MELKVTTGAWYGDSNISIKLPENSDVQYFWPKQIEGLTRKRINKIFDDYFDSLDFKNKLKGKKNVCIVIDDITRPTPIQYPLEIIIDKLALTIPYGAICILIATGAHKPMSKEEIVKKVGKRLSEIVKVINHDFTGRDLRYLGELKNGPIQLNQHFLDADLRITVGGILPHNETGFGGGAKLIVPGIAGADSISFFHGSLVPRTLGQIEGNIKVDRRGWAEEVTKKVGVDLSFFILINSHREIADIFIGDIVSTHRQAASKCEEIVKTTISRKEFDTADLCVINCYPLDTDPVQMGKALLSIKKYFKKKILVINSASDGIFYHGMGMGSGVNLRRLIVNSVKIFRLKEMNRYLKTIRTLLFKPHLFLRYSYFFFNVLAYSKHKEKRRIDDRDLIPDEKSKLIIFSKNFPSSGLIQKYPNARLIRELNSLELFLSNHIQHKKILVFPCAPLQILNVSD